MLKMLLIPQDVIFRTIPMLKPRGVHGFYTRYILLIANYLKV